MPTQLIISAPDSSSLQKSLGRLGDQSFGWVYLGQSPEEFNQAEKVFQGKGELVDTTDALHRSAESLRQPYLSYLYEIGASLKSILWWLTTLSYRSVYLSETFLQACFLKTGLDVIQNWSDSRPLVIVVPSAPLRRAFRLNVPAVGNSQIEFVNPPGKRFSLPGMDLAQVLARRCYFVFRETRRIIRARQVVPKHHFGADTNNSPTTLIVSSVSHRNVQLGPEFHTFFFAELAKRLNDWGNNVALMPLVLLTVPYKAALSEAAKAPYPVFVPHRYLKLSDVLKAALGTIRKPPSPKPVPPFESMEVGPLLWDDLHIHRFANGSADALIMAAAFRRMAQTGLNLERIVYVYENQPWERALCWEARRSFPEAQLVGYQHSRAPRMLLNLYLATSGEKEAPLPDRVVTVGEHTARLFKADGWHPDRVRLGGAFQGLDQGVNIEIGDGKDGQDRPNPTTPTVLIAPSIGWEEARELVDLALQLYKENQGVKVIIKCHPTMSFTRIIGQNGEALPPSVEISEEDILTLMAKSSLMVYTGSTVCIPALSMGLPLVHLNRRFGLNLDPLEADTEARLDATGLEDLKEKVAWLLENREDYIAKHLEGWQRLVQDMYGPVTEDSYLAFVE